MAFDSSVGGVSSNSYASVAEADTYFATRQNASAWAPLSNGVKETLLITATSRLDVESWRETRTSETQRLQWPRYGIVDQDDFLVASDAIPRQIKEALFELAWAMYGAGASDWLADTGLEAYSAVSVGSISVTLRDQFPPAAALPTTVERLIRQFVAGRSGFKIVR